MRSQFFTDTRELDGPGLPRDKVCVCLRLNRRSYQAVLETSSRLGLTSGEYIEQLIRLNVCGREIPSGPDSPSRRFPPAPPAH